MECPICFEQKDDFYNCEICKESICQNCKSIWKKDCPYCRANYTPSQDSPLIEDTEEEEVPRFRRMQVFGFALIGGLFTWFIFQ